MTLVLHWVARTGLLAMVVFALAPAASAVPIDGDLAWDSRALVEGALAPDPQALTQLVYHLPPQAIHAPFTWVVASDRVLLTSIAHEEYSRLSPGGVRDPSGHGKWENATYEFEDSTVTIQLRPTDGWGATALVHSAEAGSARFGAQPQAGVVGVQRVDPTGPLMEVPSSAEPGSVGRAYTYEAPAGDLLEISGWFASEATGHVRVALFGWSVTVSTPHEGDFRFDSGVAKTRDPTTGLTTGTRLEYVLMEAEGARFAAPAFGGQARLYSPTLNYLGAGEFPHGQYRGQSAELAPTDADVLDMAGSIWLSVAPAGATEAGHVRAWGDASWSVPEAAPVPVPIPAPSVMLLVAATGLLVGSQAAPHLGRFLRAGLFGFYARLREQDPDANPTRLRIFELIRSEPGLNLSRIVETLDIGWGTAAYHVQILKRQTRVKELRFLNRVCFFPSSDTGESQQLQTVLLRQPNYREVMTVLEASPGLSQREVATRTGHARQYISRLVAKMERAGLLRAEPSPTGRRYFPLGGPPLPNGSGNGFHGAGTQAQQAITVPPGPGAPPGSF